jgi:hypothetical protein
MFDISLIISVVVLFVTGHFGASLTHGEGYLFPPKTEETLAINDQTPVFEAAIQPILKAKCYQCHNEQKQKGQLLMTTWAGLLKGGKNGPIWVAGDALKSHILQRANLPLDDKKHMPPKGKPQLTPQEIGLLTAWINAGADPQKTVGALAANDPLKTLLQKDNTAPTSATEYDFDAADAKTIEKLNNPFRSVFAVAHNSPALHADFFVRQAYKPEQLGELSAIKSQLVSLNLTNMPVKDEDLKTIAQFENLEKLILNNTDITGQNLTALQSLSALRSLSLSGTKVTKEQLSFVNKMPQLKEIFIWNTAISEADIALLQKQCPKVGFQLGYVAKASEILKLNPPMLVNEQFVLTDQMPVTFKHPLKGVTIRYTLDGTTPDSTSALVYDKPIYLSNLTVVKAIATKENWYASNSVEYTFFKGRYRPKTVQLLNEPNPQYPGEGSQTLTDFKKGDPSDFKNKAWLGYREKPFEALFTFEKPMPLKTLTISTGRNVGGSIFPPTALEIWGGNEPNKLQLLQKIVPLQPTKNDSPRIEPYQVTLKEGTFMHFKVIARPVAKIPVWHSNKNNPGWVFVDEVFFN